ncbi:DNA polymerase III subunit beta family protein [Amycolatopsis aidingensis]|uniref:DNA polymerase III subunit beta family protein n=1 Tax=Amycolatopsis aidingensis TaxID=2842453 RepID=UPI001E5B2B0D|nr:MerR family transcriptional regulator [Amycolatopsis aidingensis]
MDDASSLLSISAFARTVGLTPSALRYYDDCGVLRPARVDEATGYRYYGTGQQRRAIMLRTLRRAGLPLPEVAQALDGAAEDTRHLLRAHLDRIRQEATAARAAVEDLLRTLPEPGIELALGGAELASAVRQVAPAAGTDPAYPQLTHVLIELDEAEVRLVATDRYRLALRVLEPARPGGGSARLLVPAAELLELGRWAVAQPEVVFELGEHGATVRAGGQVRTLPAAQDTFPAYREVLDGLPPRPHRVIVDRVRLHDALPPEAGQVMLSVAGQRLLVADGAGSLPAICLGSAPRIAFDPGVLGAALESSVGPDVLLEIGGPAEPVVVRSADQGSFTALVMPVEPAG